jgi:hypothetical protein
MRYEDAGDLGRTWDTGRRSSPAAEGRGLADGCKAPQRENGENGAVRQSTARVVVRSWPRIMARVAPDHGPGSWPGIMARDHGPGSWPWGRRLCAVAIPARARLTSGGQGDEGPAKGAGGSPKGDPDPLSALWVRGTEALLDRLSPIGCLKAIELVATAKVKMKRIGARLRLHHRMPSFPRVRFQQAE